MTIEAGVLVGMDGKPIYWHVPPNRNVVALPDSRDLWDVMWENRANIAGFAHSHPGYGWPEPSNEDITTFSAVELALGRRLWWWIASANLHIACSWKGPEKYTYELTKLPSRSAPEWMPRLRELSRFGVEQG